MDDTQVNRTGIVGIKIDADRLFERLLPGRCPDALDELPGRLDDRQAVSSSRRICTFVLMIETGESGKSSFPMQSGIRCARSATAAGDGRRTSRVFGQDL